ncbi:unnamed protein product, partial [marine sediment metagenome]
LGRIINRIDYEKLIFDDIFPDEIQTEIKQFISSFTN